jgi:hypothetical protein
MQSETYIYDWEGDFFSRRDDGDDRVIYGYDEDDGLSDYEFDGDADCFYCGGDGFIDGYEDDPLWFEPGELERCSSCSGSGRAKDMTIW